MLKRREKARIIKYVVSILSIGFFIGLFYVFLYSQIFKVKSIEIKTNESQKDRVLSAIIADISSRHKILSILSPDNILFWELGSDATSTIPVPDIKSVSITSLFFKKKVEITTEERKIKYVACRINQECFRMDEDGIVFKEAPNMEGYLITKIIDENNVVPIFGKPLIQNKEWQLNMFAVMNVLKANNMPVKEIRIKEYALREYEAIFNSGVRLRFDFDVFPKNFDSILKNTTKTISLDKIEYIDFRIPNKIFYK